jgi:hypothetical protein
MGAGSAAAQATQSGATAKVAATSPTGDIHDFDYFEGGWNTRQHRLRARGVGSTDWEDFPGTLCMSRYLGGVATVDELSFPTKGISGLTLRAFDRAKRQWSIYWLSSATGSLGSPVVGGFTGDVGEFYGSDEDGGRPVIARYVWRKIDRDHARWEQSFSYDRRRTWEINWTADFIRADQDAVCENGRPSVLAPRLAGGPLSSAGDELNASFTPDGQTVYFTRKVAGRHGIIMRSYRRGGEWTTPTVAPFSGQYSDFDPFVTPDGRRVFWISVRPVNGEAKTDTDIWMAEWHGDDWGPAVHLEGPVNSAANEYYPTVAQNGTLYFSSTRPEGKGRGDLYFSRLANGRYDAIHGVDSVNTAAFEGDAFIAPDESYLLFTGFGRTDGDSAGDLFVSTNRAGIWSAPRRLEHGINTKAQEYAPIVAPDGQWLYFTSYRAPIDETVMRPFTRAEAIEMGAGPLNGLGNVYRIPIAAVLSASFR